MKINRVGKCALLGMVLPLALSGAARAQDTSSNATNASDASDVFEWKLQPPVGLRGRYTIFTRTKVSQNLPGQPARGPRPAIPAKRMDIESRQTMHIDYETISRDDAGNTVSRLTYRDLNQSSTQKIDGKNIAVPTSASLKELTNIFQDVEIDIKQAPDGRVLNMLGLDVMQRRFNRIFAKQNPSVAKAMKPFMDGIFGDKMLRQMWDTSALRPKNPVRVGERWDYTVPLNLSWLQISLRGTRTLQALDGNFATVADRANLSLQTGDKAQPLAKIPNAPKIFINGGGTMDGKSLVNRETGMETETFTNQRLTVYTTLKTLEKGCVVTTKMPQWMNLQIHQAFVAKEGQPIH